jgi:hypothetical protein
MEKWDWTFFWSFEGKPMDFQDKNGSPIELILTFAEF